MNEKLIDMHIHTCYSDGQYEPAVVIKKAIENNIGIMAITDHDTINGIKSIDKSLYPEIKIIDGIELTAKVNKGQMHILGYNYDINDVTLNNKMIELHNNSVYSLMSYLCELRNVYGISFETNELLNILNKKTNMGRPDIARLLVEHNYVKNNNEAFDKYLVDVYNRVRNNNVELTDIECIDLIKKARGLVILAHPHTLLLDDDELFNKIKTLKDLGLDGIEVYHSKQSNELSMKYLEICKKLDLLYSGGSDYHGEKVKPDVKIGTGCNNLNIKKLSLVNKIEEIN